MIIYIFQNEYPNHKKFFIWSYVKSARSIQRVLKYHLATFVAFWRFRDFFTFPFWQFEEPCPPNLNKIWQNLFNLNILERFSDSNKWATRLSHSANLSKPKNRETMKKGLLNTIGILLRLNAQINFLLK